MSRLRDQNSVTDVRRGGGETRLTRKKKGEPRGAKGTRMRGNWPYERAFQAARDRTSSSVALSTLWMPIGLVNAGASG